MNIEKQLIALRKKLARLEAKASRSAERKMNAIPKKVGFKSVDELVLALLPYASTKVSSKVSAPVSVSKPLKSKQKRRRTVITPQMRQKIEADITKGMKGSEAVKKFGISLPTFYLMKSRMKKAVKPAKKTVKKTKTSAAAPLKGGTTDSPSLTKSS